LDKKLYVKITLSINVVLINHHKQLVKLVI